MPGLQARVAGGCSVSGGGHGHDHSPPGAGHRRPLAVVLGISGTILAVEVAGAVISGSLALLADAGHMLTDAGALAASLLAFRLARRPGSGAWTFGFRRAEVLSAQANGITLLVVSALVAFEAISRLIHPVAVTGGIVVGVAAVGVAVNVAATWVLRVCPCRLNRLPDRGRADAACGLGPAA